MYTKFKYVSLCHESHWNKGLLVNLVAKEKGMYLKDNNKLEDSKIGFYYSNTFDSNETGNEWHKILLYMNREIYNNFYFILSYYSSDIDEFENFKFEKIKKYNKNEIYEKYWERIKNKLEKPIVNPKDVLLRNAKGRFLWIKLEIGINQIDDYNKDLVLFEKIRIYYPKMSFLSYLPGAYQENEKSNDFLERYLSIFTTIYDEMEEKIDNISKIFDVDFISKDFLKWLSKWLSVIDYEMWENDKLKILMKKIPRLYKIRGTKTALEKMIEIYTGERPYIIECFEYENFNDDERKKLENLYGNDVYRFIIFINNNCILKKYQLGAIIKIIEEEKPAHTNFKFIILNDQLVLDSNTYMGINSKLGSYENYALDDKNSILYNVKLN